MINKFKLKQNVIKVATYELEKLKRNVQKRETLLENRFPSCTLIRACTLIQDPRVRSTFIKRYYHQSGFLEHPVHIWPVGNQLVLVYRVVWEPIFVENHPPMLKSFVQKERKKVRMDLCALAVENIINLYSKCRFRMWWMLNTPTSLWSFESIFEHQK